MPAYEIEIILNRQLADCLSMPVFITDTQGNLIFYNEPAEQILGTRFEDSGEMKVETWSKIFKQQDEDGNLLPPESLPLVRTIRDQYPYHKTFLFRAYRENSKKFLLQLIPLSEDQASSLAPLRFFGKQGIFDNRKYITTTIQTS